MTTFSTAPAQAVGLEAGLPLAFHPEPWQGRWLQAFQICGCESCWPPSQGNLNVGRLKSSTAPSANKRSESPLRNQLWSCNSITGTEPQVK